MNYSRTPVYFDGYDPPGHITVQLVEPLRQYTFTCPRGHNTYQPTVPNTFQAAAAARFAREHASCRHGSR